MRARFELAGDDPVGETWTDAVRVRPNVPGTEPSPNGDQLLTVGVPKVACGDHKGGSFVISVRAYVEHPSLALADTIREVPDVEITVFSDAGTDPIHDVYFFQFEAADFEAVESALAEDHTVASFNPVMEQGDKQTYRIEYSEETKLITPVVTRIGGIVVDSRSYAQGWLLDLNLQEHEGLYELDEAAAERDIQLEILEIEQLEATHESPDYGLTEPQREALVAAFVQGYYDHPRQTSLENLAKLLDISPTAASGRLRRGSARLIEETLVDEE